MDTIYSAANSASRTLFGESTTDTTDPTQKQYQKQDRTSAPTNTDNNPFHSADDTNPFRYATENSTSSNGSGTKHAAGSGLDSVQLNKPYSESTGSTPSAGFGSLDSGRTFDKPADTSVFEHGDELGTTTSAFEKPSVGDFNKDGVRHEIPNTNQLPGSFDSENQSTINDVTGSRFSEDTISDVRPAADSDTTTRSFDESPGASQRANGSTRFASDVAAVEGKHRSNTDIGSSSNPSNLPGDFSGDFSDSNRSFTSPRDSTFNQNSNPDLQDNRDTLYEERHDDSTPAQDTNTQPRTTDTDSPESSLIGAAGGSGAVTAAEPSVDANRPQETPEQTEEEKEESAGTGEKWEKSTGVIAEGGDFDASRPGAGREADRLLDQKGIHHGKEGPGKGAPPQITPLHSKLVPHLKKDKDASKPAEHKDHHNPAEQSTTDTDTPEHKKLGTKIKEKLHIGHH